MPSQKASVVLLLGIPFTNTASELRQAHHEKWILAIPKPAITPRISPKSTCVLYSRRSHGDNGTYTSLVCRFFSRKLIGFNVLSCPAYPRSSRKRANAQICASAVWRCFLIKALSGSEGSHSITANPNPQASAARLLLNADTPAGSSLAQHLGIVCESSLRW